MSPKKSVVEETDAEKVPLRHVRRKLAVHMDEGRSKFFEWSRGKQGKDCQECDGSKKLTGKHKKYWEGKNDSKRANIKNQQDSKCACTNAHNRKRVPVASPAGDQNLEKATFDRIVENAAIEWDYYKSRKKNPLMDLLKPDKTQVQHVKVSKDEKSTLRKVKSGKYIAKVKKVKIKRNKDENDIYAEHVAMQLRNLKYPKTVALARLKIDQVIFRASIGGKSWTHKHLKKLIQNRQQTSKNKEILKASEQS